MKPIRVFVADDHAIVRDGFISLLSNYKEIVVVGYACHENEIITSLIGKQAEILLLDISIPIIIKDSTVFQIKKQFPDLKILALTMHDEPPLIKRLYELGVEGYLSKNSDGATLLFVINRLVKGDKYFDSRVIEKILSFSKNSDTNIIENKKLSQREIEIVQSVVQGLTSKEIAHKLFITSRTVDTHRNNIMKKLNARNTADIVRFAISNHLI